MRKRNLYLGALAALGMAGAQAHAAIIITNPSFEADAQASGTDNFGSGDVITGWNIDRGDTAVFNPDSAQFAGNGSLNGSNVIWMNGAILHQDLGTMVAGNTYTFDVSYGWRSDLPGSLDAEKFAFILRPGISSATAFVVSQSAAFTEGKPPAPTNLTAPEPVQGALTQDVFSYTAGPADDGQVLTLQLQASDLQLLVDQVSVTTTSAQVPEPASLAALGLISAGLLGRRRARGV